MEINAENVCMKMKNAWVCIFKVQKNIMKEGVWYEFEIEYLYVHNTLLKHHEDLEMYHEQMPSLSEKM